MATDTLVRATPKLSLKHRHPIWLGAISVLAAAIYAVLGLVKLGIFRATTFDLVIVDQAVRNYAKFLPGYIPSIGIWHGRGLDYPQIADHFSPIYAVLAPFYWIHDGPTTLIIAQAVLFASAVPFIWMFTRRLLGTTPAYLVSVAYALSWPVAQAVNFDVHEVMFVPLLTAIVIERYQAGRLVPCYLALFGLLLVKEDMGLMVAGFGLYVLTRREWAHGTIMILSGFTAAVLTRGVIMPAVGGQLSDFWAYSQFGPTPGSAAVGMITHPFQVLDTLFATEGKTGTIFFLLWPTLLLCLLSPLTLMALPHLLERFLGSWVQWHAADYQYNAFTVVVLLLAGVDGFARLLRWLKRSDDRAWKLAWSLGVLAVALTLVPRFAFGQLLSPAFYRGDPVKIAAAEEAASRVPDGVTVATVNYMGPALTDRTTVLLLRPGFSYPAPWIVADTQRWEFPYGSAAQQAAQVEELVAGGYERVFERNGVVVLRRP
ncbi:DUF2079 domain-containing protein [Nonomuraea sp. NPDC050663]|uniref:DUF2079 domain-containing protein n=1 Tax=Nonomuraea sp. NPDC050663 TaxID=3364370 RepID=UPI0037A67A93